MTPKRFLCYILGLASLLTVLTSCKDTKSPEDQTSDAIVSEQPEQTTVAEQTEPEPLPYLIPYPDRINLAELDAAVFKEAFPRGTATTVTQGDMGLEATAKKESRDPSVAWSLLSLCC